MDPSLTSGLKWLKGPILFKLRNFQPQGGGRVFEALSSYLVII